jgi:hypothetical protein
MRSVILLGSLIYLAGQAGCGAETGGEPEYDQNPQKLTAASSAPKILHGVYTGNLPDAPDMPQISLAKFEADTGIPVASVGLNAWWYHKENWYDPSYLTALMRKWVDPGHPEFTGHKLPVLQLGLINPPGPNDDVKENIREHLPRAIVRGDFDEKLAELARHFRDFKYPFMMRLMWEANGGNYSISDVTVKSWNIGMRDDDGSILVSAEDVRQAWIHVVDIFRANGAHNVIWVWSHLAWASTQFGGSNQTSLASFYPGDDYVDWIGTECYNFFNQVPVARWTTCHSEEIQQGYNEAASLSPIRPMMWAEWGSVSHPTRKRRKGNWIRATLDPTRRTSLPQRYPRIKAIYYWNDTRPINDLGGRLAIQDSGDAISQYSQYIQNDIYRLKFLDNVAANQILSTTYQEAGLSDEWVQQKHARLLNGLVSGTSAASQTIKTIAGYPSSELYARSSGEFVTSMYRIFLVREPDPSGLDFWTAEIDSGRLTKDEMLSTFSTLSEFTARMSASGILAY